ncbi:MAG: flagellar biosynthetic protein FliO [Gammaproteobacteria bacterium]|nr:flagellar biosynthetic protein FliO [Gammaproteobacteria bacterium]
MDKATESSAAVDLVSQPLGIGQLFQTFFSLLLVILLILAIAWMIKRSGRFGSALGGQLRAIGGLSLGGRDRILLVDAGGTHLLLGISPGGGIQTLYVFPEPLELGEEYNEGGTPFATTLQRILKPTEQHHERERE